MSSLGRFGARRLAVIGAAAALGSGVASVGVFSAARPAKAAPLVVRCPTDNLQTAINGARSGSTIHVKGTCTGHFTIPKNLKLAGPATLDGGGVFPSVLLVNPAITATLDFLTIEHGFGGISNSGTTTLNASQVSNNMGGANGGGISNQGGTLTLNTSQVSRNTAFGLPAGGGISNQHGTVTLNASQVFDNMSEGEGFGGGILNLGGTVTLNASRVSNNTSAEFGGGIVNGLGSGIGTLTLNASRVSNNTAGTTGGGISNQNGTATLKASAVFDNTALGGPVGNEAAATTPLGGGIFKSAGTVNLLASRVFGNHPDNCAPPNSVAGCTG